MAISPIAEFPGKVTPATAQFPFGKAQNITLPGDGTGTPWDSKVVNDMFGLQQALLSQVGAVPSGTPDEVGASQYLDAINTIAQRKITRTHPDTLAIAVADSTIVLEDVLHIADLSHGGGAIWDVVVDTSVTPDGLGIILSATPGLALVQRLDGLIVFSTVANLLASTLSVGQEYKTYIFNTDVIQSWVGVSSGAGDFTDGTLSAQGGSLAKLQGEELDIRHFGGKPNDSTFDNTAAKTASWGNQRAIYLPEEGTYFFDSPIQYPANGRGIIGVAASWFNGSSIAPGDNYNPVTNPIFVDMNENSPSFGGQVNILERVRVIGGMIAFDNPADPFVGLTAVSAINTKDKCTIRDVFIVDAGVPADISGFIHDVDGLYMTRCHLGPNFASTGSSTYRDIVLQTCFAHWGTWTDANLAAVTYQQGSEQQALFDDRGVNINGDCSVSEYFYTEGGNKNCNFQANSTLRLENPSLGFSILFAGGSGHTNFGGASGARLIVEGGRKFGPSSHIFEDPDLMAMVWLNTADPLNQKIFNNTDDETTCENVFYRSITNGRTLNRVDNFSQVKYYNIPLTDGVPTTIYTMSETNASGRILVYAEGASVFDQYIIDFSAAAAVSPVQSTLTTNFRNTGGAGNNNIVLSISGNDIIATASKAGITVSFEIQAIGTVE